MCLQDVLGVWEGSLAGNALEDCACVCFSDMEQWQKNAHIYAGRMALEVLRLGCHVQLGSWALEKGSGLNEAGVC